MSTFGYHPLSFAYCPNIADPCHRPNKCIGIPADTHTHTKHQNKMPLVIHWITWRERNKKKPIAMNAACWSSLFSAKLVSLFSGHRDNQYHWNWITIYGYSHTHALASTHTANETLLHRNKIVQYTPASRMGLLLESINFSIRFLLSAINC